jgi:hypothetical protein
VAGDAHPRLQEVSVNRDDPTAVASQFVQAQNLG